MDLHIEDKLCVGENRETQKETWMHFFVCQFTMYLSEGFKASLESFWS